MAKSRKQSKKPQQSKQPPRSPAPKLIPKAPAQPIAQNDSLKSIEGAARKFFYLQKLAMMGDDEALSQATHDLTPRDADPSSASANSFAQVTLLDERLAHAQKFDHPRRKGAFDDLGKLMLLIALERPQISNHEMWSELANPATRARLLPGVIDDVAEDRIDYHSRGKDKSVSRSGFRSRMTRIRKHLK